MASTAVATRPQAPSRSGTPPPQGGASPGRYPARRTSPAVTRRGGRTQQQRPVAKVKPRSGGRTQQGTQAAPAAPSSQPSTRQGGKRASGLRVRPRTNRPLGGPARMPSGNYQPVILAEFIGVILVIALSPVARGQAKQGLSPYAGTDMVKLAGATLLYGLLAFLSVTGQGVARLAAWFGGLTFLAVLLAEGSNIASEIGLFTGGLASAASGGAAAAGSTPATSQTAGGQLGSTLANAIPGLTEAADTVASSTPAPNTTLGNRVGTSSQAQP